MLGDFDALSDGLMLILGDFDELAEGLTLTLGDFDELAEGLTLTLGDFDGDTDGLRDAPFSRIAIATRDVSSPPADVYPTVRSAVPAAVCRSTRWISLPLSLLSTTVLPVLPAPNAGTSV